MFYARDAVASGNGVRVREELPRPRAALRAGRRPPRAQLGRRRWDSDVGARATSARARAIDWYVPRARRC